MSIEVITQTLLSELEEKTEKQLQFAISVLQNLNENVLQQPSSNGGWSIAQCLWHLNSYGDYYLPKIENGLKTPVQETVIFKSSWLGSRFTRMMQPGNGKYKAFKDHVPPVNPDAREVIATFIQQLEQLLLLLRQAKGHNLNSIKIPVSISRFIKLKLGDVFSFLVAHNQRHLEQAKRNLN
ncbi:MAG: DinB family protein [Bacteroidia bacterium]|nr:DinB family protein [Bacteroidia bacterium]